VLTPREFTTRTGGLFLFIPDLVRLGCDTWGQAAKLPGSRMVPCSATIWVRIFDASGARATVGSESSLCRNSRFATIL
jgi:hypothetical protein